MAHTQSVIINRFGRLSVCLVAWPAFSEPTEWSVYLESLRLFAGARGVKGNHLVIQRWTQNRRLSTCFRPQFNGPRTEGVVLMKRIRSTAESGRDNVGGGDPIFF
uniref:Uncharacterized protein n=1 Tax=Moniliophthora roreri TaxID=221103 RepID=A0A0W0G9S5_MONRR